MATVTGFTAARMLAIEAASVISGAINGSGHLILTKHDASEIDAGYMLASVPDASDTVKGIVELATDAESITGTDAVRAVTPASLKATTDALATSPTVLSMTGEIKMWAGPTAPTGWLLCDGSSISRTTYAALFAVISPSVGTATMTIASPGVVTKTAHGLVAGDTVYFTTTGALPTGLSANTIYYVLSTSLTADTFKLGLTDGGAAINTSGSQSGVHTLRRAPYGIASSTNFNVPDLTGRVPVGLDDSQTEFSVLGKSGGANTHTLTTAQIPSHNHTQDAHTHAVGGSGTVTIVDGGGTSGSANVTTGGGGYSKSTPQSTTATNQATGGGGSHNNLQPYLVINHIIKT